MNKLNTLLDAIKAALRYRRSTEPSSRASRLSSTKSQAEGRSRRSPKRAKASTQGRSVYTIPCVAYTTIRCREYAAFRRRKVVDRF